MRQETYVSRDTEARARNSCCRGKAKSVTYSECVFVALSNIYSASALLYCHLWPLRPYLIFAHYLIKGAIFGGTCGGGGCNENKICVVLIFSTNLVRKICHSEGDLARYCRKCM